MLDPWSGLYRGPQIFPEEFLSRTAGRVIFKMSNHIGRRYRPIKMHVSRAPTNQKRGQFEGAGVAVDASQTAFCSGRCPGHLLSFHKRISGPPPAPPPVKAYGIEPIQQPRAAALQEPVKENYLKIHCPVLMLLGENPPIELS